MSQEAFSIAVWLFVLVALARYGVWEIAEHRRARRRRLVREIERIRAEVRAIGEEGR